jgi:hypothetical protein
MLRKRNMIKLLDESIGGQPKQDTRAETSDWKEWLAQ